MAGRQRKRLNGLMGSMAGFAQGPIQSGSTIASAGSGSRASPKASRMPTETTKGGGFQFGVNNPAYQPLADGLNKWLAGGFSGPNAPGSRGPAIGSAMAASRGPAQAGRAMTGQNSPGAGPAMRTPCSTSSSQNH